MVADVEQIEGNRSPLRVPASAQEGWCCWHDIQAGAAQTTTNQTCSSSITKTENCRLVATLTMSTDHNTKGCNNWWKEQFVWFDYSEEACVLQVDVLMIFKSRKSSDLVALATHLFCLLCSKVCNRGYLVKLWTWNKTLATICKLYRNTLHKLKYV